MDVLIFVSRWNEAIDNLYFLYLSALQGSRGNTPLHFACLLERTKHAEMLLEYGATPDARNQHGQKPLDLLPRDAVRSTKLHFKRIFDVSFCHAHVLWYVVVCCEN